MIYILAFFLPPLALLLEGRIGALIVNLILLVIFLVLGLLTFTFVLWLVPSLHAIIVIYQARKRREHREIVEAIRRSGRDPRDFDRLRP